jgi:hypothetical protein
MENLKEAAQIFARALSNLLEEREGILIRPKGDECGLFDGSDNLLAVTKINHQIAIIPLSEFSESEEGYEEGHFIQIEQDENEQ